MDLWARLTYITRTFRVGFAPRPMPLDREEQYRMPWSNQGGGGGWQGGRGPWGQGPSGPPGRGGGNQPPDLEELIRKSQERLRQILPGGSGTSGGFGRGQWLAVLALVLLGWLYMSANTIKPDENGLVLRLGTYHRTVGPGLHFVFWPVERIEKLPVEAENQIDFGGGKGEGLMLAGDQNIVDMRFTVLWKIKDPRDFLFNIAEQEELVTRVSESAMREVVGRTPADEIRTRGRQTAQDQVRDLIQKTLDDYHSGVLITGVQLEKADPPPQVVDAFEEVQRAEQNQNKLIREAEQYRNQILGQARGDSSKIVADGKAYKSRVVAEAQGEAKRFLSVHDEYEKAKDVTRQRLFLETIEDVLQKSNKVIIDEGKAGPGVVPYLPLPELQKRQPPPARTATTGGQ
jgi:membrane protease subunit HflK